jgi:hypothetical protein
MPFANSISSLGTRCADWLATAARYYAAAAAYEQLSRLSDAELHRRGFSRASLASDICAHRPGSAPPRMVKEPSPEISEPIRRQGSTAHTIGTVNELAASL